MRLGTTRFIRQWIGEDNSPLELRIKRMAFTMAMLIVLLLVGVMLMLTLIDIPANQMRNNQNSINFIGEVLSNDIDNQLGKIHQLSNSSLVWTALTDSAGRDAYLRPFMHEQEKYSGNTSLQLLDYRGRVLLGKLPPAIATSQVDALASKVIAEKRSRLTVIANNGRPLLLAMYPVTFPYTQESIGVLLGAINLSELFQQRASGLASDLQLELNQQNQLLATYNQQNSARYFPVQFTLSSNTSIDGGPLSLELHATHNPWLFPILERVLVSILLAAMLGAFVWRMAGTMAHRLAQRLNQLAQACIDLSEGKSSSIPHDPAQDEIGVLTRTLHLAIESYDLINAHLEELVEKKIQNLSESEARFRSFFENNSSAMLLIEPSTGELIDANLAASNYYQLPREQLVGKHLNDFEWHPDSEPGSIMHHNMLLTHDLTTTRHQLPSGEVRDVELYSTPIISGGRQLLFSIIHDITARKRLEEQVRQLAFYDPLTRLPNRRLLNDRMEQAISANKRRNALGAFMFLDLDNFKPLNDKYGHAVGDLLLIQVADRLKGCVREMDTVARLGGDEFVVMLSEVDHGSAEAAAEARKVAEKIRNALAEPYFLTIHEAGHADMSVEHRCTASIGVAIFDSREHDAEEIIQHADAAMYHAKESGRNAISFYSPEAALPLTA